MSNTLHTGAVRSFNRIFFGDSTPLGDSNGRGESSSLEDLAKLRADLFKAVIARSSIVKITGDAAPTDSWFLSLMRFTPLFDWVLAEAEGAQNLPLVLRAPNTYFEMYSGHNLNDSKNVTFGQRVYCTLPIYAYDSHIGNSQSKILRVKHRVMDSNGTLELIRANSMRGIHMWHANGGDMYGRIFGCLQHILPVDGNYTEIANEVRKLDRSDIAKFGAIELSKHAAHITVMREPHNLSLRADARATDDRCGGHPHSQHGSRDISSHMCQGTNPFWKLLGNGGAAGKVRSAGALAGAVDNLATWIHTANLSDMYGPPASVQIVPDQLAGMQPDALTSMSKSIAYAATRLASSFLGIIDDISALHYHFNYGSQFQELLARGGMRSVGGNAPEDIGVMSPERLTAKLIQYADHEMTELGFADTDPGALPDLASRIAGYLGTGFAAGQSGWKVSSGTVPLMLNGLVNIHATALANAMLVWLAAAKGITAGLNNAWSLSTQHASFARILRAYKDVDLAASTGAQGKLPAFINATMMLRQVALNVYITCRHKRWDEYMNRIYSDMMFSCSARSFDRTAFAYDTIAGATVTYESMAGGNGFYLPYMNNSKFATWLFSPVVPLLYDEFREKNKSSKTGGSNSDNTSRAKKNSDIYKDMAALRAAMPANMYNW